MLKSLPTLGYGAAFDKKVGDFVSCGVPRRILEVRHAGKNWPLYRLEGIEPDSYLCDPAAPPGFVSWHCLGDVVEES